MADNRDIGGGTIMVAFVCGALTGATLALLFAPAAGEETREYLGQKAREGRAKAREALDNGREYYEQRRKDVTDAISRGREAFQQARGQGGQQSGSAIPTGSPADRPQEG